MSRSKNIEAIRGHVHHMLSLKRQIEVDVARRNAQTDSDLLFLQELDAEIAECESELRWARFVEYLRTPCWRYRVL